MAGILAVYETSIIRYDPGKLFRGVNTLIRISLINTFGNRQFQLSAALTRDECLRCTGRMGERFTGVSGAQDLCHYNICSNNLFKELFENY